MKQKTPPTTDQDFLRTLAMIGVSMALVSVSLTLLNGEEPPPPSITAPGIIASGTVVDVYDVDTITVEVTIPLRLRLKQNWAPELKRGPEQERQLGKQARDLARELSLGKPCLVVVDLSQIDRSDKAFTFGRLLADVYITDPDASSATFDLSAELRRAGVSFATKAELKTALDNIDNKPRDDPTE